MEKSYQMLLQKQGAGEFLGNKITGAVTKLYNDNIVKKKFN